MLSYGCQRHGGQHAAVSPCAIPHEPEGGHGQGNEWKWKQADRPLALVHDGDQALSIIDAENVFY